MSGKMRQPEDVIGINKRCPTCDRLFEDEEMVKLVPRAMIHTGGNGSYIYSDTIEYVAKHEWCL